MRVVYLIAGAGGMYCGSCLRDNRLAATLIEQGRNLTLIPLYTPIRTDEPDATTGRVFFGGLNVYLAERFRPLRRLPAWMGRMLDAAPLLRLAGRRAGDTPPERLGDLTISVLEGESGAQRRQVDQLIEGLRPIAPDIVNLPNLMFVGLARSLTRALHARVVCTLSGEDIFLDELPEPHRTRTRDLIRKRAEDVDGFIAPTQSYASFAVDRFNLPSERVHVVPLGIAVHDVGAPADPPGDVFTVGYLARICPPKGLENLIDTLIRLRRQRVKGKGHLGRPCRVRAAGYLGPSDRAYLDQIVAKLRACGMTDAFEYVGEVDRAGKFEFLRSLHALSVPTVYREAKGLYVLEAMACGVPVVQPAHGSFPELIEASGGGLLYDPGNEQAHADALAGLMDDDALRRDLAAKGRAAVHADFTDKLMADRTWTIYERYAQQSTDRSDAGTGDAAMQRRGPDV